MTAPCAWLIAELGFDDLAADVPGYPHPVDLHAIARVHGDLGDVREVPTVAVLERHAHRGARRQTPGAPSGPLANQFEHAPHARRVETVAALLRLRHRRTGQQIEPELNRILAGRLRELIDEGLERPREGVAARGAQGARRYPQAA